MSSTIGHAQVNLASTSATRTSATSLSGATATHVSPASSDGDPKENMAMTIQEGEDGDFSSLNLSPQVWPRLGVRDGLLLLLG